MRFSHKESRLRSFLWLCFELHSCLSTPNREGEASCQVYYCLITETLNSFRSKMSHFHGDPSCYPIKVPLEVPAPHSGN